MDWDFAWLGGLFVNFELLVFLFSYITLVRILESLLNFNPHLTGDMMF